MLQSIFVSRRVVLLSLLATSGCLTSSVIAQTKYVLGNGHLNVKQVMIDIRGKDAAKAAAARKAAANHNASAINDFIAYLEKEAKDDPSKLTNDVVGLALGYGPASRPYFVSALKKGSNVAKSLSSFALYSYISRVVDPENAVAFVEAKKPESRWVFQPEVKAAILSGITEQKSIVKLYSVGAACLLGLKQAEAPALQAMKDKKLNPYLRWMACADLIYLDLKNDGLLIDALKDTLNEQSSWFNVGLVRRSTNDTAYQFLIGLMSPTLYKEEATCLRMQQMVMKKLCDFRRPPSADIALKALQSKNLSIVQEGLKLLGASQGEKAIPKLQEYMKSDKFELRDGALQGLGLTWSNQGYSILRNATNTRGEFLASALEGLGHGNDPVLIEFLNKFVGDEDRQVAFTAQNAIEEIKTRRLKAQLK